MDDASSKCQGRVVWSYTSALLVFMMIPGLAFFEGGLVRAKTTVSILTQVFTGHCMLTVMWVLFGFSLTFGNDAGGIGVIGNLDHLFLLDMPMNATKLERENKFCEGKTTRGVEVLFELMFATISPLLMTGAYAERLRFKSFLLFTALWELFIYYPVAHWVWGPGGWLMKMGVVDFAGGIVIHATSGVSSLYMSWLLGHRSDWGQDYPPSNVPLAATGCALLWFGWGGFNAGGTDGGAVANLALLNTHIAAAVSAMVWLALSLRVGSNKPRVTAVMNGAVAGLAGITPAAGYVGLQAGMIFGVIVGVGSYAGAFFFRDVLRIDDALEVSAVHGVSGVLGALYIGVAASGSSGGITASGNQFGLQLFGLFFVIAYTATVTWGITVVCRVVLGPMRVTAQEEEDGLDTAEHQEVAYNVAMYSINEHSTLLQNPASPAAANADAEIISLNTSLPTVQLSN